MPYMYIIKCSDGTYYTGSTRHLKKRIEEHNAGEGANYTRCRLPVELVHSEYFDSIKTAFDRENQVKRWSRKKKEALIFNNKEKLHELAECKNKSHSKYAGLK